VLFGNPLPNELATDESGTAGYQDGLHAVLSLEPPEREARMSSGKYPFRMPFARPKSGGNTSGSAGYRYGDVFRDAV
jgi:hypothetical protein